MIATVTLNPSLDRIVSVGGFSVGATLAVSDTRQVAGGKGINVARVIKVLGGEVIATGFLGGPTGELMERKLKEEGLRAEFVKIKENTRNNLTILDPTSKTQTHLMEPGPKVDMRELSEFMGKFKKIMMRSKFLVLAGSLPPGVRQNFYAELIQLAKGEGVRTVLDSRGEALLEGLKASPFMVKPNRKELEEIAGKKLRRRKDMIKVIRSLLDKGIKIVALSLGRQGAVVASNERIWSASPPQVKVVNSVGSGDALVAGLIYSLTKGRGMEEAIRLGMACATANAIVSGAGFCGKEAIKKFYHRMPIGLEHKYGPSLLPEEA
ncbi:1-phosphofructokinase [bacterium]|nr:1-phosphofructokinase [bacterium]MCK4326015.1 1-phosphofructokinase [bacterium]MCK4437188.1 1-phosphofructokinase [bacterium]